MKRLLMLCFCAGLLAAWSTTAMPGGEAHLFLGQKGLDSDWNPVDDQTEYGINFNFGIGDWPVALAVDILTSEDSGSYYYYGYDADVDGETLELDVGVRKSFGERKVQPYLGGGIAYIDGELKIDVPALGPVATLSLSDAAVGLWADVGVMFQLGERFNLGIDVRYSSADVDFGVPGFGSIEVDAGGTHYGVVAGFRWGE